MLEARGSWFDPWSTVSKGDIPKVALRTFRACSSPKLGFRYLSLVQSFEQQLEKLIKLPAEFALLLRNLPLEDQVCNVRVWRSLKVVLDPAILLGICYT